MTRSKSGAARAEFSSPRSLTAGSHHGDGGHIPNADTKRSRCGKQAISDHFSKLEGMIALALLYRLVGGRRNEFDPVRHNIDNRIATQFDLCNPFHR
jgi:hypothetical protein